MSVALSTVRTRIRNLVGDVSFEQNKLVFPAYRLDDAIGRNIVALAGRLQQPLNWDTTFATLVAGTESYAIDEAFDFQSIQMFRLATSGTLIEKVQQEVFHRLKDGHFSGGPSQVAAIFEAEPATVNNRTATLRLWPAPTRAEQLEALIAQMPSRPAAAADVIGLSELGQAALEYMVAAELLAGCSQDRLDKLGLSKEVIPLWNERASKAEFDEHKRYSLLAFGQGRTG